MQPLRTPDGLALHRRHWPATTPRVRGTVQLVHGLGEHVGRHADLARNLNAAGWDVTGHDQRGHGRSEGRKGAIPHADALLADLALAADAVRAALPPGGHHVLLGHSMGGCVAARFVAETLRPQPAPWAASAAGLGALVLSSPALAVPMTVPQRLQLAIGQALLPDLAVGNGLAPEWLSRDPAVVADYRADPLVHDRITPRLAGFIVRGGEQVRDLAPRWQLPTLLMWGGADRCVDPEGAADFAAHAAPGSVSAERWGALAHEIFHEPERGHVVARLLRWLDQRFPEPEPSP